MTLEEKTSQRATLYPFGYGLSYTTFEYKNMNIALRKLQMQKGIIVAVDVTNIGKRKGDEVVQLYIKDVVSSVITYETQLRGFERISLASGETKTVFFKLKRNGLEMLDKKMHWIVEPGMFTALIGSSSEDIRTKKDFWIK